MNYESIVQRCCTAVMLWAAALGVSATLNPAQAQRPLAAPGAQPFPASPLAAPPAANSPAANSPVANSPASNLSAANLSALNSPAPNSPAGAADEQPVLRVIPVPPLHVPTVGTAVGLRYRNAPGVQISPDRREGHLLVMAPERLQEQIAADVARLLPPDAGGVQQAGGQQASGPQAGGVAMPVSFGPGSAKMSLHRVGWQRFEDHLMAVVGRRLPVTTQRNGEVATFRLVDQPLQGTTVEVDRRENSVTVFAPKPAIPGWQKMVGSLDQTDLPAGSVTELVRIENAEPGPIQRAVRLLGSFKEGETAGVTRIADTPLAVAVQQSAQPPAGGAGAGNAGNGGEDAGGDDQAVAVAVAGDDEQAGVGLIGDVQIQFVPELGIIVVKGSKRDVARVMDVIKQIEDKAQDTQPEVVVYPLEHVNSGAIEALLSQLYEEVLSARQGDVSITSLDKPNALLLIGRPEAVNAAKELIGKLDQPVPPATQLRVFRLEHASALDAEEKVTEFFVDSPGSDELRPGLGVRARVVSDYRTNSLIVQAAPRDLLEVAKLVQDLDVADIPAQSELRIIPLRNALAEDLVEVIRDTISGTEETQNENVNTASTSLSMVTLDAEGNRVLNSGILTGVVVTADANANAIVVRGPSNSLPLIEEMVRQLDQTPGTESLVKVFTLENGDAQQLTAALQQLFGTEATTGGVGAANLIGLPQATAATESSLVPLRFSSDIRTNSIIATGSASDLEVVESILLRLDTTGFADRMFEVVWLRNQSAADVAAALQGFVQGRQQGLQIIQQAQQGGLSPFDALERDVVVVAEPVSNSLVISVAPRLYSTIRRMIDQLDRRAPMVLVKVLIAEVRLSDGFEFGTELGLQNSLQFDRGIAADSLPAANASNPQGIPVGPAPPSNPGFNFNNNGAANQNSVGRGTLAERVVTSFATGTSSSAFGYGGFVLSAASDSVSLLMRALQDAGRLQILSRPQLMTMDNTIGEVQVGSLVPRITNVTTTGVAGTTFATEDLQVGLILRVRPRVGRDGLIVMEVDAIRSALDTSSPGIPVGFSPTGEVITSPQIQQTLAQSVVTAYSGQTVVYGGLIQKERSQISRRVPYLSNIPILGHLLRFDRETEVRSELLVVLTPMIISSEEDLEYVKQVESSRMSWCLADVVEMHGDEGLSGGHGLWGPALAPVIYPDLHPTIDDIESIYVPGDMPVEAYPPHHGLPHHGPVPGPTEAPLPPVVDETPRIQPAPEFGPAAQIQAAPQGGLTPAGGPGDGRPAGTAPADGGGGGGEMELPAAGNWPRAAPGTPPQAQSLVAPAQYTAAGPAGYRLPTQPAQSAQSAQSAQAAPTAASPATSAPATSAPANGNAMYPYRSAPSAMRR
ncbi:secretin N-terminal domain-containing protein [Roseimaritima sediminicola]|uniref:secretin N-terminal domain-containing protein n=1 Tax=Roseimaritima sediminicola TaxID=2662066 RepID=UPI00129848C9|nr:secretin N-terminal domain-containing protein [Roseimaritima sediminicola]